jgi:deoxyribodipyrimidine photo-lyase
LPDNPNIVWFRQDLRMDDNPALAAACSEGQVIAIYILDDANAGQWKMGGASRTWLHHALSDLNQSLGGMLNIFSGDPQAIFKQLNPNKIFWNRCYEPWRIDRDTILKEDFQVESYNGSVLWEPWEVLKKDGTPYKVFTPFYQKGCMNSPLPRAPLDRAEGDFLKIDSLSIAELKLLDHWSGSVSSHWDISENGAHVALSDFLENGFSNYKEGRDFPNLEAISKISAYLHFGQLSPQQVWSEVRRYSNVHHMENVALHFLRQIAWREFSYSQLFHNPDLPTQNLRSKFDDFAWQSDEEKLMKWKTGQTGFPLIDAGMRELWQTGFMHNRVRMLTASFLVKNLMIDWRLGAAHFWDCLFDADLANNSASWQWVAGCGTDCAPYFRIFNPVTQGEKFDSKGDYVRKFVPELSNLPHKYIHSPWLAPQDILNHSGVILGQTYPRAMVDLKVSREAALSAFRSINSPIDFAPDENPFL